MSEGLGFESQCMHFGHPSAGGCQRSTGDPRLILGKGYRHVGLGGYWRTDPLLNKPFNPNGIVVGILTVTPVAPCSSRVLPAPPRLSQTQQQPRAAAYGRALLHAAAYDRAHPRTAVCASTCVSSS
ncbi:unnamed protein product [Closterium sp. NIES-54]